MEEQRETCTQIKGGRGKKAPYRTVSVRCPEPVKPLVLGIIHQFHQQTLTDKTNSTSDVAADVVALQKEIATLKERIEKLEKEKTFFKQALTKASLEFSTFKAKVVSLSYLAVVHKFGKESLDIDEVENIGQSTVRLNKATDP